jgi:hypothetical protein
MKIIVSSAALLKYLCNIQEFLKGDAKIRIDPDTKELQIDGFKGLDVEWKGENEREIPVQKLIDLKNVLMRITDQPLTIKIDHFNIGIQSIII